MSKSAQAKLLFLISCFTRNSSDWLDVFSSPLPRLVGYPKRDKTIKKAIASLLNNYRLDYKKDKEMILIRPTKTAYAELSQAFPFYQSFIQKWDGKFRMVTYDIAEDKRRERDRLRRILQLSHLRKWQNSVWITPYPVEGLLKKLKSLNLDSCIQMLEVEITAFAPGKENFIEKVWNINKLQQGYQALFRELQKTLDKPKGKRRLVDIFRKSFLTYEKLLKADPGLPEELLPKDWLGIKVRKLLKKLQKSL